MDAAEWDERYARAELVWGAEPNQFVAAALTDATPGRALDVASGEGRNAIWLATRGWHAVGVDFSATALDRARQLAEQAGVGDRTEFTVGDVVAGEIPPGPFDAVVVAYLHLPAAERRRVLRAAAERVAPGGVLLVVGHDSTNLTEGVGGPQDSQVLYTPVDIVTDLDGGLRVVTARRVHRHLTTPDGDRSAVDALVVATCNDEI